MDAYDEESLPISLIRQHCFCPRIPYFNIVLGITPPSQPWVKAGVSFHEKMAMLEKRRNLAKYGLSEDCKFKCGFSVKSRKLGIHGICDGALFSASGNIYPVEFKTGDISFIPRGHRMQLIAYALALGEMKSSSVSMAFLLYGARGKVFRQEIDDAAKRSCIRLIDEIKENLARGILPASAATERQCCQCEFLNFCADRL
jgi:CRISPR-associated exonuclease Cas4